MSAAKLLPDAELVGEEAKGDPAVLVALMFEEEVNEGLGRGRRETRRELGDPVKAVAFGAMKAVVDVGTWDDFQAGPGNGADDVRREILPEKRHGSRPVLETRLGELVVRLMQTIFRNSTKFVLWLQPFQPLI